MLQKPIILKHNISCNMDMINEFADGVSGLFMNAQDILSDGEGILKSIEGIVCSIPEEARYAGLLDCVHACCSKIKMCDMSATSFGIIGKTNSYVDNLYSIDNQYAEKIGESRWNKIKERLQEENFFSKYSCYKKNNYLEKYALGNVKYYNTKNDISDTKLNTLKRLNELYSHIEDQKGRDYYQEKINHFFYENIEMELPQKINNKDDLIKVESIVEECRYVSTFDGALRAMNEDLVILRRTELPADEKVKLENEIEKLYKNVLLISFLKKIELGPKYGPNNEINNPNYIIKNNEILIKVQNAGDGGITIGYGCLIDSEEDAKKYGFKIYGLNNSVEQVIDEIERQESEYEEYDENPAMLSEEAAEKLLIKNMQEKSRYAEQLLGDKRTEFDTDEINGFVSALYNGGNIKNEDSFLYYLVRKDREGALDSIRRTEQGNGYDNQIGRLRRRLMEFNIFFNGDYTYYQDTELEKLKEDIGYYE